jgi:hypothetical protein
MARFSQRLLAGVTILGLAFLGLVAGRADEKQGKATTEPGAQKATIAARVRADQIDKVTKMVAALESRDKQLREQLRALHRKNPSFFLPAQQHDLAGHLDTGLKQVAEARNHLVVRLAEVRGEIKALDRAGDQADPRALQLLVKRSRNSNWAVSTDDLKGLEPKAFLKLYRESLQWEVQQIQDQLGELNAIHGQRQAELNQLAELLHKEKDIWAEYESLETLYKPLKEIHQKLLLEEINSKEPQPAENPKGAPTKK